MCCLSATDQIVVFSEATTLLCYNLVMCISSADKKQISSFPLIHVYNLLYSRYEGFEKEPLQNERGNERDSCPTIKHDRVLQPLNINATISPHAGAQLKT